MSQIVLSHSSKDDTVVRRLRQALAELGVDLWTDSRELRGGDPLWPAIEQAIGSAAGFAVLVSPDALQCYERLGDPGGVSVCWHQTGIAYQQSGQPEAAEDAYRESLKVDVRLGDRVGQTRTLTQLGNLYKDVLNRPEESVPFYRQAADLCGPVRPRGPMR